MDLRGLKSSGLVKTSRKTLCLELTWFMYQRIVVERFTTEKERDTPKPHTCVWERFLAEVELEVKDIKM